MASNVPIDLLCTICHEPFEDPIEVTGCEDIFCSKHSTRIVHSVVMPSGELNQQQEPSITWSKRPKMADHFRTCPSCSMLSFHGQERTLPVLMGIVSKFSSVTQWDAIKPCVSLSRTQLCPSSFKSKKFLLSKPSEQRLLYLGKQFKDEERLSTNRVEKERTIYLILRLLGGFNF